MQAFVNIVVSRAGLNCLVRLTLLGIKYLASERRRNQLSRDFCSGPSVLSSHYQSRCVLAFSCLLFTFYLTPFLSLKLKHKCKPNLNSNLGWNFLTDLMMIIDAIVALIKSIKKSPLCTCFCHLFVLVVERLKKCEPSNQLQ